MESARATTETLDLDGDVVSGTALLDETPATDEHPPQRGRTTVRSVASWSMGGHSVTLGDIQQRRGLAKIARSAEAATVARAVLRRLPAREFARDLENFIDHGGKRDG